MPRTLNPVAHAVRRDSFVEAAQRLIQMKGYEQMSIQDVLDELDASKGAFYHYFDSKVALLEAVVESMVDAATSALEPVVADPDLPALQKLEGLFTGIASWKMEKNAAAPAGGKGTMHWGFDSGKNKLVESGFDNMGSAWSGTSDGEKAGITVWTEEGTMMGRPAKTRTTVTRKSPTQVTLTTEIEAKPGAWQKLGEDTCKKK